jgi:hypothetical protein
MFYNAPVLRLRCHPVLLLVPCLCLAITVMASATPDPGWQPLPPMPLGVIGARAVYMGDRLVVVGGLMQSGDATPVVQTFDFETQRWSMQPMLKEARWFHALVKLDEDTLLVAGGTRGRMPRGSYATAGAELLNLKTGESTPLPRLPMPTGTPTWHRLADGKVLVIGHRHAARFDPATRTWDLRIGLREPREDHASTVMKDGRVMVIGGVGRQSIEIIDLEQGISVMQVARLPLPLDDHAAVTLPDGRVWVLGGQFSHNSQTTDRTWLVWFNEDGLSRATDGPRLGVRQGIADACLAVLGDHALLIGGESQVGGRDTELHVTLRLDLRTLAVTRLRDTIAPHDDAAIAVDDRGGRVWMLGGLASMRAPLGNRMLPVASPAAEVLIDPLHPRHEAPPAEPASEQQATDKSDPVPGDDSP